MPGPFTFSFLSPVRKCSVQLSVVLPRGARHCVCSVGRCHVRRLRESQCTSAVRSGPRCGDRGGCRDWKTTQCFTEPSGRYSCQVPKSPSPCSQALFRNKLGTRPARCLQTGPGDRGDRGGRAGRQLRSTASLRDSGKWECNSGKCFSSATRLKTSPFV